MLLVKCDNLEWFSYRHSMLLSSHKGRLKVLQAILQSDKAVRLTWERAKWIWNEADDVTLDTKYTLANGDVTQFCLVLPNSSHKKCTRRCNNKTNCNILSV